ncbi:MAG: hypothetical protein VB118_09820 [Oscillospiraceae bacterium]|nr:hypothetical protein [Oscillospiraceae bacterium]
MKKVLSMFLAFALIISFCAIASINAFAADQIVYVDGTAGTDGDGTKAKPFNNLVSAYNALSKTGGTITITGDVAGDAVFTDKVAEKNDDGTVKTDESGKTIYTDEWLKTTINLPRHDNTIIVTGDGGKITFANSIQFNNYDSTIYRNLEIDCGGIRVMFDAFQGNFVAEDTVTFSNCSGSYIYCTGTMEMYATGAFAHSFVSYNGNSGVAQDVETVFVVGKNFNPGTIWGGLGNVSNNLTIIAKEGATINKIAGTGQASAFTGTLTLIDQGATIAALDAKGTVVEPAYSVAINHADATNFKATDYAFKPVEVNENATLFNKVDKEYKVAGAAVNSPIRVANPSAGSKLFAVVNGKATEISYWTTVSDGAFFSTVDGATNYVFADASKAIEKPDDTSTETPKTGDTGLVIFALLAFASCAGIIAAKKSK